MGSLSVVHWLILLVPLVLVFVPIAMILRKAGYSPWLALIGLVPGANLIGLWLFAFVDWPATRERK